MTDKRAALPVTEAIKRGRKNKAPWEQGIDNPQEVGRAIADAALPVTEWTDDPDAFGPPIGTWAESLATDKTLPATEAGRALLVLLDDVAHGLQAPDMEDRGVRAILAVEAEAAQACNDELLAALRQVHGLSAGWDEVSEATMRLALSNIHDTAARATLKAVSE